MSGAAPTVAERALRGNDAQVHGSLARVEALLMSPDLRTRELMALTIRSIKRRLGSDLRFRAAANGELALRAALRDRPEIVVADELASRMGPLPLARYVLVA